MIIEKKKKREQKLSAVPRSKYMSCSCSELQMTKINTRNLNG